ncbi:MAG: XRE family transcriptional regulator [bacterium]|nr:MAG: XRE family transcriptional regulator [bacterium]
MIKSPLPNQETMYKAVVNNDSKFEGIFFIGVRTTGIFCRPTCPARLPKKENIEFFSSTEEALSYGYRPCKICRPIELYGETPNWLKELLKEISLKPGIKLKDGDLRTRGIDPARIRRWFKRHHGITFQAYLRSLRISRAFGQIRHHEEVIGSAFENGFESLSGFTDAFKKTTGFTPSESSKRNIVSITRILTPLGPMFAGATDEGICLLEFTDRRMLETQFIRLRKLLNAAILPGTNKHFKELSKQINEYFGGMRQSFDLPLVLPGTDFQLKVWKVLQEIPYGTTRSYQDQAIATGNPKAVRAVARANGDNRIGIIIPCHRVIGKDGKLAGYGGGLWRKQYLLNLENEALKACK